MSNSLLSSGRAEADILFSVCFQVCGSFGAEAEKPASDDAGTGKRLEPETGFCASKKPPTYKREKDNAQFVLRKKTPRISSSSDINSEKTVYYSYR